MPLAHAVRPTGSTTICRAPRWRRSYSPRSFLWHLIVVPAWMLDLAACAGMELGPPRVAVAALAGLHRLLVEHGFRRSSSDASLVRWTSLTSRVRTSRSTAPAFTVPAAAQPAGADRRYLGSRARVRACQVLTTRSRSALALSRWDVLPSADWRASGLRTRSLSRSMAGLRLPLSTLHGQPRGCTRMTRADTTCVDFRVQLSRPASRRNYSAIAAQPSHRPSMLLDGAMG